MVRPNKAKITNKRLKPTEICGWYGMSALILGYILVSLRLLNADGLAYQLLNITGAAGLLVVAESKHVVQSVIANIFWILIGIVVVSRILFSL